MRCTHSSNLAEAEGRAEQMRALFQFGPRGSQSDSRPPRSEGSAGLRSPGLLLAAPLLGVAALLGITLLLKARILIAALLRVTALLRITLLLEAGILIAALRNARLLPIEAKLSIAHHGARPEIVLSSDLSS